MSTGARNEKTVLVGESDAIRAVNADIDCAAKTDAKVLITGETGSGKEVVARLIHQRSARARAPLVTLTCAGVPDTLLESELFGYARGSFTDAYRDKPGLLELAADGTILLDEVGEMSARMQSVLLRFLETGELQRVGANRAHARIDVRLIAATNRNLQAQVLAGAFREDLFYRLNVIQIVVPPLRERLADVPALVEYMADICRWEHRVEPVAFSPEAVNRLRLYHWPGNVRELKNVIERSLLRARDGIVSEADLPSEVLARSAVPSASVDVAGTESTAARLTAQMLEHGDSFWNVVYPLFIARDLTRDDLRAIIRSGLETSRGSYRDLVQRFNMPPEDYKRFLGFLRKHDCHLPFHGFRAAAASLTSFRERPTRLASGDRQH
ncbi:MAG: sigma 54-interacting transcriptional regulator [Vicinamibacterales bacterium]